MPIDSDQELDVADEAEVPDRPGSGRLSEEESAELRRRGRLPFALSLVALGLICVFMLWNEREYLRKKEIRRRAEPTSAQPRP
jgi:hypothetical protein